MSKATVTRKSLSKFNVWLRYGRETAPEYPPCKTVLERGAHSFKPKWAVNKSVIAAGAPGIATTSIAPRMPIAPPEFSSAVVAVPIKNPLISIPISENGMPGTQMPGSAASMKQATFTQIACTMP